MWRWWHFILVYSSSLLPSLIPSRPHSEGPLSILSPTAPPDLQIPRCLVMFSQPQIEASCPGLHPASGSQPQMAAGNSQVRQVSTEGGGNPAVGLQRTGPLLVHLNRAAAIALGDMTVMKQGITRGPKVPGGVRKCVFI